MAKFKNTKNKLTKIYKKNISQNSEIENISKLKFVQKSRTLNNVIFIYETDWKNANTIEKELIFNIPLNKVSESINIIPIIKNINITNPNINIIDDFKCRYSYIIEENTESDYEFLTKIYVRTHFIGSTIGRRIKLKVFISNKENYYEI